MRDIGKNIKDLRTRNKMTQDELAEKLFVTRQTVSNYEIGKSRPDVEMLLKIAEVLGADINELLYEPVDARKQRKRILYVICAFSAMAVLGLVLHYLLDSTMVFNLNYPSALLIAAHIIFQPAYFYLLGWLLTASSQYLQAVPPAPNPATRYVKWIVLLLTLLLILALMPYIAVVLGQLGLPYIRITGFWLKLAHLITENRHFIWISLLLGAALGLCQKSKS